MTVLGWLLIHALFVAAGGGLIAALGMVRATPRGLLWAIGPSYLAGVAMVVLPLIALGVIGVPVTLVTVLVVGLVEAGGLLAFAVMRGEAGRALAAAVVGELRAERAMVVILVAGLVGYLLFAGAALTDAPISWDAAHMWELKALALYHFDGLPAGIFTDVASFAPYHMDYPLLQPMFEATIYHGLGHEAVQFVHVELWGLWAAALWTAAWLLAPGRRALTWLPFVVAIGVAGGPQNSPTLGNADLTAGLFVGLGALSLGLWLEKRDHPHLVLGALFLAAGANGKKEGLAFAAAVVLALVGVLIALRAWRLLGRLAVAGIAGVLLVVPWLLYVQLNDLPSGDTTPLSTIIRGNYLSGRLGRLGPSIESTLGWLVNSIWTYAAPALLAVTVMCFIVRFARPLAAYYAGSVTLMIGALLWTYWTGNFGDLQTWLSLTGARVVGTMAITSAFGVAQIASVLLARGSPAATGAGGPPTAVTEWPADTESALTPLRRGAAAATPSGRSRG
jgi:hypothetical protein